MSTKFVMVDRIKKIDHKAARRWLRGAGDKSINHWLQVPTTKIKFGPKDTLAVYKKLQQFF